MLQPGTSDVITNPALLVEVLSSSTELVTAVAEAKA
jgi:hypothetical protein